MSHRVAVVVTALGAAAAGAVTAVRLARARYGVVVVVGISMEPTLHAGDRLLFRRGAAAGRGDVVVLDAGRIPGHEPVPGDPARLVKRVTALGGDSRPAEVPGTGTHVPAGHLVVRGDNVRSIDSRAWGVLSSDVVVGVVRRRRDVGNGADDQAGLDGQQR